MSDWPRPAEKPGLGMVAITPMGSLSLGTAIGGLTNSNPASTAWPSANRMIFIPFRIPRVVVVRQFGVGFGSGIGGNFSVGVWDRFGGFLCGSGSTGRGTSSEVIVSGIDWQLGPGVYYMGLQLDGTGTVLAHAPAQVGLVAALGIKQATPGVFAHTDTVTFQTVASAYIPWDIAVYVEPY